MAHEFDCDAAIAAIARRDPQQTAVIDGDRHVSFADFDAEIGRRADLLRGAGLSDGHRVALVAESSFEFLATALAVWRAHGVLVTIYPSSGPEDLSYAIESSDPALIAVSAGIDLTAVKAASPGTPIVSVDDFSPATVRRDTQPNPEDLREPLSLICFSSGTTSRPKAIMLTARAVYNCADTYGEVWHLGPHDRGIVCLPMAWMYGLASTSLALLMRGATAIVVRRARPELLVEAIVDNRATFLAGVTTTFAKLVQHAERTPLPASTFESLRLCISGGEPRNEKAFERWHSLTGVAVLDAYCASECLPLVTYDPFTDPVPRPGAAGKLMPRSLLRIVDTDGADVPQGDVGEGLSSGPGVMLGYWRDPEQTRKALTKDGWYRTKDLLRMDADGFVYVVGRLSDVIIRAGVNISPAEVERVIRLHESVDDVAVVGLPDEMYGQRVVAAITSNSQVDLDQVDAHVRAHLSSYKVPSDYVLVEQLPVNTTTGKVDRRGLATQLTSTSP